MFLNKIIGLLELLKSGVQIDSLVNKAVFHKVTSCILLLSLVSEDFTDEPLFIQSSHLIHLVGQVAEIDKFEVTDAHEGLPSEREVLGKQRLDTQGTPVLLSHTDASDLVGH